jgi:hypothetical protein
MAARLPKVTGSSGERDVALLEGGQRLVEIGFSDDFVRHAVEHARTLDAYVELDLTEAALEVQIVSSADGCSHFIGRSCSCGGGSTRKSRSRS